jgi:hypothetical protein
VLPRELRDGRWQDKLGRGLGPPIILYHDRAFPTTPLSTYARAEKKNYVGNRGVVLSWSKRKPDYERVREYCGGDSEWRGPGRLRGPRILLATSSLLFLLHVIPLLLASLIHARRPTPCLGLPTLITPLT